MRPDYHATSASISALRELGWRADLLIPETWPTQLTFGEEGTVRKSSWTYPWPLRDIFSFVFLVIRYKFIVYYGRPPFHFSVADSKLKRIFGADFCLELSILRALRRSIIYIPTGCLEILPKAKFSLFDEGKVCGNCGFWDKCDDEKNEYFFQVVRRYCDFGLSDGALETSEYPTKIFPWKSIDLDRWSPGLEIPSDQRLPESSAIRIMHSSMLEKNGRNWAGRNIKGTPFIVKAVERLKSEGHDVQYVFAADLHIEDVRFVQAQADIVVEQLIYGWWGSTGVETMALGKPVVCYLRQEWKENFLRNFPEHKSLPIVEADTESIYEVLKELVLNKELRMAKGRESRDFAERHFSPELNSKKLESLLLRGEY